MRNLTMIFFMLLIISCSNNLSRDEAEQLINNSEQFQETGKNPKLNNNAINGGFNQGLWSKNRNLTSKGYKYFNNISYGSISPKTPLYCKINSIDGIADSKNLSGNSNDSYKEAQFTWEFSNVNSVTKRFILKGGKGIAYFRKFDDGWRIDKISTNYSNESFTLNESDKSELQNDIALENQRRLEEKRRLEEERARRKAEEEKRKKLIAKAKIINKTIGNYTGVDNFTGRALKKQITLTDVHLYRDLSGSKYLNIWFGSINTKPTIHTFRQTAMGWNGFQVKIGNKQVNFKDENEASKFHKDLISAIENWNNKYPELKKW
jgi:hypothetical protein